MLFLACGRADSAATVGWAVIGGRGLGYDLEARQGRAPLQFAEQAGRQVLLPWNMSTSWQTRVPGPLTFTRGARSLSLDEGRVSIRG